jgi:hypothetical protein
MVKMEVGPEHKFHQELTSTQHFSVDGVYKNCHVLFEFHVDLVKFFVQCELCWEVYILQQEEEEREKILEGEVESLQMPWFFSLLDAARLSS